MTCIAAIATRGRVYMGADSAVSSGDRIELLARPKVRRRNGLLIGACGDMSAVATILDGIVYPEFSDGPLAEWLTVVLWPLVHGAVRVPGVRKLDWTVLVGARGLIGSVDHDGSTIAYERRYTAVGSGQDYALGALCGGGWRRTDPAERVRRAIAAASEHCGTVRGRIGVLSA